MLFVLLGSGREIHGSPEPVSPTVFGAGVISTGDFESHPAFTPDEKTVYFLKDSPDFNFWTIVVSHNENGKWSDPQVADFSGQYADADPFITPDGLKFIFISNRPVEGKSKEDLDIWIMEKKGAGWGEPLHLDDPVNSSANEWYPTMANDGTIYFGSTRPGGKGRNDLYRCRFGEGKYQPAENLGEPVNTEFDEYEPFIGPDQSYLIFMARHPEAQGGFDLFITFYENGQWTKPKNLGDQINSPGDEYSPKISPDGKYFFFTSTRHTAISQPPGKRLNYDELIAKYRSAGNGLGDIYQIPVSALPTKSEDAK